MGCGASVPKLPPQPFVPFIHPPVTPEQPLTRVVIIANPRSGGGDGLKHSDTLASALTADGIHVTRLLTERPGHAIDLAALLDTSTQRVDAVLACGGDGTAHEVINGLLYGCLLRGTSPPPVALVPCGSGNTLAFSVGLNSVADALAAVKAFRPYLMDVVELTRPGDSSVPSIPMSCMGTASSPLPPTDVSAVAVSVPAATGSAVAGAAFASEDVQALRRRVQWSVNMVGWGLSSAVLSTANNLRWCGSAQYNCAAYSSLIANRVWLAGIDWVSPTYPLPIDGHALAELAREVDVQTRGRAATVTASAGASGSDAGVLESKTEDVPPQRAHQPLLPLAAPPSTVSPFVMIQVQTCAYMGEKLAFCPLARMDDGFMDVCAVLPAGRLQLVSVMDKAKASGRHVLESEDRVRTVVRYAQARELVLLPMEPADIAAWRAGHDFVVAPRAGEGVQRSGDAVDAAALAVRARERSGLNVAVDGMSGEACVNVDGELSAPAPLRMRVLSRVVPLLCLPKLAV